MLQTPGELPPNRETWKLRVDMAMTYVCQTVCSTFIVQQPSSHFSLNLAKIPPNQVIADFVRGSSVESESE